MTDNDNPPLHHSFQVPLALDEHRAFLEKAHEVARLGSWVAELDGSNRLSWSAETFRIFGVEPGEFNGTRDGFFAFVHPDDLPTVRNASMAATLDGRPYEIEHRIVTGNGNVRWVLEKADVLRDDHGVATRMIGTIQDVTERRQLEEQVRHAQKMEAIGQLAGGIAHDLNNALTAVVGYTELALAELDDGHPARQDVDEIRRAAARAASVARQLLAFSRKQMLEPRLLDVNNAVEGLARLLRTSLGENVRLLTHLAPGLPPVMGDPGQVEQAIVNLAVNGRDAMPQGGDLVIQTSLEEVPDAFARTHTPMPAGPYVVISVTDSGHGISLETQARVFEPFFTTKSIGKGTGLGLTMVYGTMKQCGGFVFVESEAGRGATFRLYFPPVISENLERFRAEKGQADSGSQTVLIVEDEPAILKLAATALKSDGYRILQASSGSEALELAASYHGVIDLVLTDATMPVMGGVELAQHLLVTRPQVAVIVMSGYTPDVIGSDADSAISTLQKPFTPNDLRVKVRSVVASRQK